MVVVFGNDGGTGSSTIALIEVELALLITLIGTNLRFWQDPYSLEVSLTDCFSLQTVSLISVSDYLLWRYLSTPESPTNPTVRVEGQ
jgi:hypothetical protein